MDGSSPKNAPVTPAPYIPSLSTEWHGYVMIQLAKLHPAHPSVPSMDVSMGAINYLCGHAVRWNTSGTVSTNFMPRTVLYHAPESAQMDDDDRLLLTGFVKFPTEHDMQYNLMYRIQDLPEIHVVLNTGYTLIIRPSANNGVVYANDAACFASFVKTQRGDVSDAMISVGGVPDVSITLKKAHHPKYALLDLRVMDKHVVAKVSSSFYKKVGPRDRSYDFLPSRILGKIFPVLLR
jgi:hypothetical protein